MKAAGCVRLSRARSTILIPCVKGQVHLVCLILLVELVWEWFESVRKSAVCLVLNFGTTDYLMVSKSDYLKPVVRSDSAISSENRLCQYVLGFFISEGKAGVERLRVWPHGFLACLF